MGDAAGSAATGVVARADQVAERIEPWVDGYFRSGEFPEKAVDELAGAGLLGVRVPAGYGGLDASTVEYAGALERIARVDVTIALTWEVHALAGELYRAFGGDALRARWLPQLASGRVLAGLAMTEPHAGSDIRAIATTARQDGADWILDGSKTFITNTGTPRSDGLVVMARSGGSAERPRFSLFCLPSGTPGVRLGDRIRTLGWRSMDTRPVEFDGCRLGPDCLIGEAGNGMAMINAGLGLGRVAFAAISTGLAEACLRAAVGYANERVQFGRPIGRHQAVAHMLADMATAVAAARALTVQAAVERDAGTPDWPVTASMAKLFASRTAVDCADRAVQVFGGRGLVTDNPVARYYADAKMMEIGEGTSEMQRQVIARGIGC